MHNKIKEKINFVFFGTPDVASETLEILKSGGYIPSLIVTSEDKPQGRKMIVTPPPVKVWAEKNKVPYIQPKNEEELQGLLKTSSQRDGARKEIFQQENMRGLKEALQFEIFIVVAYGKILPEEIINSSKFGSINIHYSLLPKYRGASPVESAILNGDEETGVSIQKMAFKMDSGPVIAQETVKILPDEKAPDLRKRLIEIGGNLLVKTLPDFIEGKIIPIPQDESEATYCKKIKKEDGLIDLEKENPIDLYNKFRAYALWPRIYFFKDTKRVIITDAVLEDNEFKIKKVLPEGKKEITWEELKRN